MERIVNVVAALICILSVIFNWGYYFGKSDETASSFKEQLGRLENEVTRNQESINNIENQVSYIRGILSKGSNNTAQNYNVDTAIKTSAQMNLPPEQFNQIFSTINSMSVPQARVYLKEKGRFSDDQIKAILKVQ